MKYVAAFDVSMGESTMVIYDRNLILRKNSKLINGILYTFLKSSIMKLMQLNKTKKIYI